MQQTEPGFLQELVKSAEKRISDGYYNIEEQRGLRRLGLVEAIRRARSIPIIAEVKFNSPIDGPIRRRSDLRRISEAYAKGGAVAISVLTEPEHFGGRLEDISSVKKNVQLPVLMKDIVVDEVQVDAARKAGADAILLLASIFDVESGNDRLNEMISRAHTETLEVIVEAHTDREFNSASASECDIIGINNRDLTSLAVSLETSRRLLKSYKGKRPVLSESGISTREHVDMLRKLGADGFLIGSALMKSADIATKLIELSQV
jgi:indole-3-glycerol phosphate synthase